MRLTSNVLLIATLSCTGSIVEPLSGRPGTTGLPGDIGATTGPAGVPPAAQQKIAYSGIRRLTQDEYNNTLEDLIGDTTRPGTAILPVDSYTPFDNDYLGQSASQALVEGADLLASDAITRLLQDPVRAARVIDCAPTGPDDAACFRHFITTFAPRALRTAVGDAEIESYVALQHFAIEDASFNTGVDTVLRVLLQDPRFLYRVETGAPVPDRDGVFVLSDYEVASRLSYLLWGSAPDDALLELAATHQLSTPDQVTAAAQRMLTEPRALERIDRFHAMWLGYDRYLPETPQMVSELRVETRAMVDRVILTEQRPWQDLFRLDETFINDDLATHYGLTPPGSTTPTWVPYGTSGRKGILSTGSFLAIGAKFEDTSPTVRGVFIRTRLFCQDIPPPPPSVDPDQAPTVDDPNACKWDRYAAHRVGVCAGCHSLTDPVGFGLENYDAQGRYRTTDADNPNCVISGQGNLVGVGMFHGPAELGALMTSSGLLNNCFATQLNRFASGHAALDANDNEVTTLLENQMGKGDFNFVATLLAYVSNPAFGYRRAETN